MELDCCPLSTLSLTAERAFRNRLMPVRFRQGARNTPTKDRNRMTYIQGVSPLYVVIGIYTDDEVAAVAAYTNEVQAMNVRDRLLDKLITPGSGVIDYVISTCTLKEPAA